MSVRQNYLVVEGFVIYLYYLSLREDLKGKIQFCFMDMYVQRCKEISFPQLVPKMLLRYFDYIYYLTKNTSASRKINLVVSFK